MGFVPSRKEVELFHRFKPHFTKAILVEVEKNVKHIELYGANKMTRMDHDHYYQCFKQDRLLTLTDFCRISKK